MMGHPIYFDHNATVPVRSDVANVISEALALGGNASSVHSIGRQARKMVEEAREKIARLIGARPAEIVFTSGGTEANNLILRGTGCRHFLASAIEHDSVLDAGENIEQLPVAESGVIDIAALEVRLKKNDGQTLVSIMLANNETGVVQPIAEVVQIVRKYGGLVHTDAIQAIGKISVDWTEIGVDFMSLSAHKIGGPQGVGALVVNENVPLSALIRGGGQERYRRAGTENVPGIVGFGVAAHASQELNDITQIRKLRDQLESSIKAITIGAIVHGERSIRLPNTSCISMPGVTNETQVMKFDLEGIMVSAGSACSSGKVQASHVLKAMGVDNKVASNAIRVSLGPSNTLMEVNHFVKRWKKMYRNANFDKLQEVA
jgi:cysteine desulfurase